MVSVTSEISVIFRYFIILLRLFNVNLKTDNYMIKIEYLIWQCDTFTPRKISTSSKRKLRNNIDVSDYFGGDN